MSDPKNPSANATPQPKNLFTKLAEVVKDIGPVEKKGVNTHFNYKYLTEEDLFNAIRRQLVERNIFFSTSILECKNERFLISKFANGKPYDKLQHQAEVITEHIFINGDNPEERHTIKGFGFAVKDDDKGPYSAITGAIKYALAKCLLVSSLNDPESHNDAADAGAPSQQQKPVSPTQATGIWRQIDSKLKADAIDEAWLIKRIVGSGEVSADIGSLKDIPDSYAVRLLNGYEKIKTAWGEHINKEDIADLQRRSPAGRVTEVKDWRKIKMPFGDHQGIELEEVSRLDAAYFKYLLNDWKRNPNFQELIVALDLAAKEGKK